MASNSASSIQKSFKNDVFLSFRGEDTRKNFVDHLYLALVNKGIITYKDDEKIEKGERINEQLIRSIEESRFYIIVLSKNYASSSWCLNELVKIMECQRTAEQTAYPVFYDVEPTEVRNQIGAVGEAFARHLRCSWSYGLVLRLYRIFIYCKTMLLRRGFFVERITTDLELEDDVGRWRNALKEAAGLAGMELKNTFNGHEAQFIQKIVQDVSLKLHFINPSFDGMLVGMESRVKKIVSSLKADYGDVRIIGIKGMGGGGKTTLARAVYDHISICYDGKSFVENVRERSKGSRGLEDLQKQILSAVLSDQSIVVDGVFDGKNMMKRRLGSRKVLIVLDDVDHIEQLEALAGELTWFKPGSRIIITTRDEQVLVAHGVHSQNICDVNLLSNEEAIRLFSRCAFKREVPSQEYEELSKKVVHYASGLPLTIKVLGSFLNGKKERQWEDAIERLETIPLKETLEKLELSYDGLENDHKEIFLEVACILKDEEKGVAIRVLESLGYHAEIGLKVLEQKSLITVSYNFLKLHDHIQEMGMSIVCRLHPHDPKSRSILCINEEIKEILVNKLGTGATKSMKLEGSSLSSSIIMKGLRRMKELRLLYVYGCADSNIDEVSHYLPDSLRSLKWRCYPFRCLPKIFHANNLVNLVLDCSNISQLWEEEMKVFSKLKFLDLSYSKLSSLNLGLTPHIENLNLKGCKDFVELNMPQECSKLRYLYLSYCKVSSLNLGLTPHIEDLDLSNCKDFVELKMPYECSKLRYLDLSYCKVSSLNLGLTPHLEKFNLAYCIDFLELNIPQECPELKYLNLSGSKMSSFNLGLTPYIDNLDLAHCIDFVDLNMPQECSKLKYLNLSGSKVSSLNLGLTPHIKHLNLIGCNDFVELNMPRECTKLKVLNLSGSKVSSLNLGLTPHIEELDLHGCVNIVELNTLHECQKLKYLNLSGSKVTRVNIGPTPHVERLDLAECKDFVEFNMPHECPKLEYLDLSGSKLIKLNLGLTPHLKGLRLAGCNEFVELNMRHECPKLEILNLSGSKVSRLNLGLTPSIKHLDLKGCNDFVELNMPHECPNLIELDLSGSKVISLNLGLTPHIEDLQLDGCNEFVKLNIPRECQKLRVLNLNDSKVSSLNLGLTPHIEDLQLDGCKELELNMSHKCPKLRVLNLNGSKVSSLNLGLTPNIEDLRLSGCNEFVELNMPHECPKLRVLVLSGSKVSSLNIGLTPNIEKLYLEGCDEFVKLNMPHKCSKLEILNLKGSMVNSLNGLDRLESLEKLDLTNCRRLIDIPDIICNMKSLKYLSLRFCIMVYKLPEELGRLKCLKTLHLEGAGVKHLPRSIFRLKGLYIIGFRWQLQSYGLTSLRDVGTSRITAYCFIE